MIVVRDVVGQRRDLRLQRGMTFQIEREARIRLLQRPAGMAHRPVMLGQPLQCLPTEVQTVPTGIGPLDLGQGAQRMAVMVEPAMIGERALQRILARMAEGRVADIVRQAERLGQVLVQPQRARDRPADLRHFQAVGQPDTEMVAIGRHEDLRLVTQPSEADRMDDPVAVALERIAWSARQGRGLVMTTATAVFGKGSPGCEAAHFASSRVTACPASLVTGKADTPFLAS